MASRARNDRGALTASIEITIVRSHTCSGTRTLTNESCTDKDNAELYCEQQQILLKYSADGEFQAWSEQFSP